MYNGIGLQTARGSGTNGYVQTNKFFVRPKTGRVAENSRGFENDQGTAGVTKKANKDILEHDRKRQIELKLVVLEDKLVDQGYTDAEIAEKLEEARSRLLAAASLEDSGGAVASNKKISDTQTHQVAARKEKQMETLRAALGITVSGPEDALELEPGEIKDDQPKKNRKHCWNEGAMESEKINLSDTDADEPKANVIIKGKKIEGKHKRNKYESSLSDSGSDRELDTKGKSKSKNRQQSKHRYDSSETDSDGKNVKRSSKKTKGSRKHTDSDSDSDRAKKRNAKQRSRRYDSSGSESDEKQQNVRKKKNKPISKHSESESGSEESDSYDDSSDTDSQGNKRRHVPKRVAHPSKQKSRKEDYSSESDSDDRVANAKKKLAGSQKRHNNDDDDSDSADDGVAKRGMESKKLSSKYADDDTDGGDGSRKCNKEDESRWENKRSEDEPSFRIKQSAGSDLYKQRDREYNRYENQSERGLTRLQEESRGINSRYKDANNLRSDRYRIDEISEERYDPRRETVSKNSMRMKGDTDDLHAMIRRSGQNQHEESRDRRHGGRYDKDSDKNYKDGKDKAYYGDNEKDKNRNYDLYEESKDVKKTNQDYDNGQARLGKEEDQLSKRKMHAREEEKEKGSRMHEMRADESPKRAKYNDYSPSDERRKESKDVGRHRRSRH